jgi:Zn-dependent protease
VEQAAVAPRESQEPPDWNEELYQATTQLLIEPPASRSAWAGLGCLLLSLALFVLSFFASLGFEVLAIIIPVLLFHEAGHWVGMRLFGYRNMRMFFIPFFGAAVSGTKHAAPAWQRAVVLLLGPLPGIVLGLALYLTLAPAPDNWLHKLTVWLVILNGINLAPLFPLDGGQLLDVLLFSRRPWLAVAFRLLAVAGLAAVAVLSSNWIMGGLGALVLLGTPARYQRARRERLFANNPQQLPEELELLDDAHKRDLFGWARLLSHGNNNPALLAAEMRSLHEHMVTRQPGALVWLLFLALYLGGVAGTVLGGAAMIRGGKPPPQKQVSGRPLAPQGLAQQRREALVVGLERPLATAAQGSPGGLLAAGRLQEVGQRQRQLLVVVRVGNHQPVVRRVEPLGRPVVP